MGTEETNKRIIVAFMGADGAGKTTHAQLMARQYHGKSFAFATPLKEMAKADGWNGVKDNDGRLILERVSKREKAEHGNDVFAVRTLDTSLRYLKRHKTAKLVCIEDLRFGIECRALQAWGRKPGNLIVFVYIYDEEAEAAYKRDLAQGLEYAWSAPELEWRGFLPYIQHIRHENDRKGGVIDSGLALSESIKQVVRVKTGTEN